MASFRGIEKSRNLQDKIHRRIDKLEEQQPDIPLPPKAWSEKRWATIQRMEGNKQ
jgi:hypothetical protein